MTADKSKAQDAGKAEDTDETGAEYSGVLESGYPQGVGQPEGNREGQIDDSEDGQALKERLDAQHAVGATDTGKDKK